MNQLEKQENISLIELSETQIKELILPVITKVNPNDYGIDNGKASAMLFELAPILSERQSLIEEFEKIKDLEVTKDNVKLFAELKGKFTKNRTQGIEKWFKKEKEFYLSGGRFVDKIKNSEIETNKEMEEALEAKAKHFENLEKERVRLLVEERTKLIENYVDDATIYPLAVMEEAAFNNLLSGLKLAYEAKQKEEEEKEQARLKKEADDKLREQRKNELLPYWHILSDKARESDFALYSQEQWGNILVQVKAKFDAENLKKQQEEEKRLKIERRTTELNPFLSYVEDLNAILDLDDESYNNHLADYRLKKENAEREEQAKRKLRNDRLERIKLYMDLVDGNIEDLLSKDELSFDISVNELKLKFDEKIERIRLENIQIRHQNCVSRLKPYEDLLSDEEKNVSYGEMEDNQFDELLVSLMQRKIAKETPKPVENVSLYVGSDNTGITIGEYKEQFRKVFKMAKGLYSSNPHPECNDFQDILKQFISSSEQLLK